MVFQKQPKKTIRTIIRELVQRTNTDTARIRVLEQEKDIIKSRTISIEQSHIADRKQMQKDSAELTRKVERVEKKMIQMETTLKDIIKEMKKLATTSKIKELENLVDIYSPLKSLFITREEVERMIESRNEESKDNNTG